MSEVTDKNLFICLYFDVFKLSLNLYLKPK